ncbi:MAG: hypothetical protein IJ849_06785 [Selenomonadaceae bacterium]|nr:hypothetical protein [Selenomonadaceae bacterium]
MNKRILLLPLMLSTMTLLFAPTSDVSGAAAKAQVVVEAKASSAVKNDQSPATKLPKQTQDRWYWLYSDKNYSKFFDPTSVVVMHSVTGKDKKKIPTEIQAIIKTGYSYGGAKETIATFGIGEVVTSPNQLASSIATVSVNPQNRTLQYLKEDFYDPQGQVVWSRANGAAKEVNSQEFDESFYAAIVDAVFRQGEMERCQAKDRWIDLWKESDGKGMLTSATADTSTMRLRGDNLIFWEWLERKDAKNNVLEIKFMKKAVNLPNNTERVIILNYWSPGTNWETVEDDMAGSYRLIQLKDPDYKGLVRLQAFAKGYSSWVKRYSLE